jgi:hypothetical protein
MAQLTIAALLFVGSHFGLSSRTVRARLVGRLGEPRFVGLRQRPPREGPHHRMTGDRRIDGCGDHRRARSSCSTR